VVLQLGVEGKLDLIPVGDFAGWLTLVVELRRFHEAEVADVVGRLVKALDHEGRLAERGQTDAARKDEIEQDGSAMVRLAPEAKVAIELVVQLIG